MDGWIDGWMDVQFSHNGPVLFYIDIPLGVLWSFWGR